MDMGIAWTSYRSELEKKYIYIYMEVYATNEVELEKVSNVGHIKESLFRQMYHYL